MKKLFKSIVQWFRNMRYVISYSVESIERSIDLDQRALKIAVKHPITPESVKSLLEAAEALGISDETVELCISRSACFGFDARDFTLEVMFAFRKELKRRGVEI